MRPAGHSFNRNKSHCNGLRPVLAAGRATIVNQEIGVAGMGHGATTKDDRVGGAVRACLLAVGVVCACILAWAVSAIVGAQSNSKLTPLEIQTASRTMGQTFWEQAPLAGETVTPLKRVSKEFFAFELLSQPNSDIVLVFQNAGLKTGNVVFLPYPHFQSVEIRQTACPDDSSGNLSQKWTPLAHNEDGSFYFETTNSINCFETRIAGISPKNVQVVRYESKSQMQSAKVFEVAALQTPYFTFLAVILIAAIAALAVTKDRHLPLYISYLMTASVFSLLMDGNGYVLWPGVNKAMVIAATDATACFAIATVALIWIMILGPSRLIAAAAFLPFAVGVWNLVHVSEAAVRATNVVNFLAGFLTLLGAAIKVKSSLADRNTRENALLLLSGVFFFNACACFWVLQNMSLIESTLVTRSAIKAGFVIESSFIMWAIIRTYRNTQESTKKMLEAENKQTQSEYYEAALHFVPRILLDLLKKDDIRNIQFGSTVSLTGSVVCLDIKGFTRWSEHRTPEDILDQTNKAWSSLIPIIQSNHGAVVSFTGDGLIALFPQSPLDALEFIITTMTRKKCEDSFIPYFEFGMGVHYGSVVFGTVGQSSQMNLTVISDIVNTAARIESTTRDTDGMIAVSAEFVDACGINPVSSTQLSFLNTERIQARDYSNVGMRYLGKRTFKGKNKPIELFDIALVENLSEFRTTVNFINRFEALKHRWDFVAILKKAHNEPERDLPVCAHYIMHTEGTALRQRTHLSEAG